MKQFIARTICAILLSPILVIMLIGYIPFAIFKGLTDNFAFSEYCNFIERITDSLLLPVTRWQDRKNRYEELKRTSEWYRKENKRLNDILDNNIQNNKSCKQTHGGACLHHRRLEGREHCVRASCASARGRLQRCGTSVGRRKEAKEACKSILRLCKGQKPLYEKGDELSLLSRQPSCMLYILLGM